MAAEPIPVPATYDRREIADCIVEGLAAAANELSREFHQPGRIPSFILDNLLPGDMARAIFGAFPDSGSLVLKRTLGQLKFVGYELDKYNSLVREAIYAFQDPRIVKLVETITGLRGLIPDDKLYAGGISMMERGHFLNPHLDNSHDKDRHLYRVLNLLFYVTPDWHDGSGGHLELWDEGPGKQQRTVPSAFNRLVVMQTDERSWHSVSEVHRDGKRCCVSNYFFSLQPAGTKTSYHVTSFRGWPQQTALDLLMRLDSAARLVVRKVGGNWLFKNPHVYDKPGK